MSLCSTLNLFDKTSAEAHHTGVGDDDGVGHGLDVVALAQKYQNHFTRGEFARQTSPGPVRFLGVDPLASHQAHVTDIRRCRR